VQRGQFVGKADIVQAAGGTGASYEINWRAIVSATGTSC